MTDVLLLAILVAFFVVALGLVKFCESIIGPDEEVARVDVNADDAERAAA